MQSGSGMGYMLARMNRSGTIEGSLLGGLGLLYILVFNAGTENGIGYFHQPRHDLLVPLIHGGLYNAATFWVHAFVLIPRRLVRRHLRTYALGVLALFVGVIGGKTAGEMLIIALDMPDLADLGFLPLALENLWVFLTFFLLSAIYGVTRWALVRGAPTQHTPRAASRARLETSSRILDFPSGNKIYRARMDEILYIEGKGNYVKVVCRDRSFMVYTSLYQAERRLPAETFLRIHRSYIVALEHIEAADRGAVVVGGRDLRVGQKYASEFSSRLGFDSDTLR